MDGKFHTVNELATAAKIKNHTASYHLKKLREMNWIHDYKQGRHVYYQLCSNEVAELLEQLMVISPIKTITSFNQSVHYQQLKFGRSCYCHLAGQLGVYFFNFLIKQNYMILTHHTLTLTECGYHYFETLGIDLNAIKLQPGYFIKPCLDWSERTFHLSGNLGKAFFHFCENHHYIQLNKHNRGVTLTTRGQQFFHFLDIKNKP